MQLSDEARQFMAGFAHGAKLKTAIANPLVNSYKRLTVVAEAPRHIVSFGNRSPMIRIPLESDEYYRLNYGVRTPPATPT